MSKSNRTAYWRRSAPRWYVTAKVHKPNRAKGRNLERAFLQGESLDSPLWLRKYTEAWYWD